VDKWSVLGIEPTKDISKIKKAYAQKLKIYHPEDDPQGFQRLREAYDSALQYSKWVKEEVQLPFELTEEIEEDADFSKEYFIPNHIYFSENIIHISPSIQKLNEEFIENVKVLYDNFFLRIDIKNWEKLLDCDAMWNISNRESLSVNLLEFLSEHRHLPQNVWRLLDDDFKWSEQKDLYYESHEKLVKYIIKQINQTKGLSYSNFKECESFDYDTYLNYREKAFAELEENNYSFAGTFIDLAKEIYADDPDLLYIEGEYLTRIGYIKGALSTFTHLLEIMPDYTKGRLSRAKIYYDKNQYKLALEDFSKIEVDKLKDQDTLVILAKCYLMSKSFDKAKEYFLKALELNPTDNKVKRYIMQVNIKIRNKLHLELLKNLSSEYQRAQLISIKEEIKQQKKIIEKEKYRPKATAGDWYTRTISAIIICFVIWNNVNNKDITSFKETYNEEIPISLSNALDFDGIFTDIIKIKNIKRLDLTSFVYTDANGETNVSIIFPEIMQESDDYYGVYVGTVNDNQIIFLYNSIIKDVNSELSGITGKIYPMNKNNMVYFIEKALIEINIRPVDVDTSVYIIIDNS
jgi:tetratricopeptide (TPR) repeat protein